MTDARIALPWTPRMIAAIFRYMRTRPARWRRAMEYLGRRMAR